MVGATAQTFLEETIVELQKISSTFHIVKEARETGIIPISACKLMSVLETLGSKPAGGMVVLEREQKCGKGSRKGYRVGVWELLALKRRV